MPRRNRKTTRPNTSKVQRAIELAYLPPVLDAPMESRRQDSDAAHAGRRVPERV